VTPPLTTLRAYVRCSGHEIELRVPAWHWAWRGLLVALALPPLIVLLALLVSLDDEGVAAPSVVLAGLAGLAFVSGVLLALLSPLLSRRTLTRIDFAQGVLTTARSPYPVELGTLAGLYLARPSKLGVFFELRARRLGAPDVRLLGPLVPKHSHDATALASWLGARLNVPVDVSGVDAPAVSSTSDQLAGVLCYLPIQGVFLIASLYYLFAARRRPFVRFCAIQSLSQFGFSLLVLTLILLALGLPLGLSDPSPLQTLLIVLLAGSLGLFWLWNFGAHAYACWAAYKGRLWVMPWLGFWVRRFLP